MRWKVRTALETWRRGAFACSLGGRKRPPTVAVTISKSYGTAIPRYQARGTILQYLKKKQNKRRQGNKMLSCVVSKKLVGASVVPQTLWHFLSLGFCHLSKDDGHARADARCSSYFLPLCFTVAEKKRPFFPRRPVVWNHHISPTTSRHFRHLSTVRLPILRAAPLVSLPATQLYFKWSFPVGLITAAVRSFPLTLPTDARSPWNHLSVLQLLDCDLCECHTIFQQGGVRGGGRGSYHKEI